MRPETSPDSFYSFYDELWKRKAAAASLDAIGRERHALPYIPPGSRVLDVGCGTGGLLAHVSSPALAVGVDFAPAALAVAKARGHAVAFASLEGPRLPFRDASFERVACLGVIEHLFDPRPLLKDALRVLSPGGLFIVLTPNTRYVFHIYRLAVKGRGPKTSGDPEGIDGGHIHYFTPLDVKELLTSAGFADVELRGTDGVALLASFRSPDILAVARKGP